MKITLSTIAILDPKFGLINSHIKENISGTITSPELTFMPIIRKPLPQKVLVTVTFCDKKNKPTTIMIRPPQKNK